MLRWIVGAAVPLVLGLVPFPVFADPSTRESSIAVHVLDDQRSNVPLASVAVRNLETGTVVTQETDAFGLSVFPAELGSYELVILRPGFREETRRVLVSQARRYDVPVRLEIAGRAEVMTVVGDLDQPINDLNGRATLPDTLGTSIFAGKKTDSILLDELDAGLAISNTREVFAKVPGTSIWENDSSGLQIGISNRGLDPNRSWEMNSRQNGYDITADIFGYPEAYYTPPLEAVERIDVVRGSAALQYGAQFGGLVNYRLKRAPTDRRFNLNTLQTLGTDGHFNSHNRIGGRIGRWTYNAFYHHRQGDGWRKPNAEYDNNSAYAQLDYAVSERMNLSLQLSGLSSLIQMPAGLTDEDFAEDPRRSVRDNQWFGLNWWIPALEMNLQLDDRTRLDATVSFVYGHREVLFDETSLLLPVDHTKPRTFWEDWFRNLSFETRFLKHHDWPSPGSALAVGVRYYHGDGSRQHGPGHPGTDARFEWSVPDEELLRDLRFTTRNYAVFAEHVFRVTPRLTVTPGFRYDQINTDATGRPVPDENLSRHRPVPLFGVGATFETTQKTTLYGNLSQCYRATLWNDYWRSDARVAIDPGIVDMEGYQGEFGWRGTLANVLSFDVGGFYVFYGDKLGTIRQPDGTFYYTNVSDSRNVGFESYVEADVLALARGGAGPTKLFVFTSYAPVWTRYLSGPLQGNRVEFAVSAVARTGVTFSRGPLSASLQHSYTGDQYTDASNTEFDPRAYVGHLPSFHVLDLSGRYVFDSRFVLSAGVSNLTDTHYATRRASAYPGPGRIPSDGRRLQIGLGYTY
jgi:Fe(3+) dicitrate transport protein